MIGVIANSSDQTVVSEFFELFKTPWQVYQDGVHYDVVLCARNNSCDTSAAKLVVTYAGRVLSTDGEQYVQSHPKDKSPGPRMASWHGCRIPIYGDCVTFARKPLDFLVDEGTTQAMGYMDVRGAGASARIGYDLFGEVRTLLTAGQPLAHAATPTLELHIALLRNLILAAGVPFAEIPAVPEGHTFIACLTHDVDHPSIKRHKCDHTMFGFLYRAILGSVLDVVSGRMSVSCLLRNWAAALKLPLVHLGWVGDFWHRFQDYPQLETGAPSSFFVIPFKNRPGETCEGVAPSRRAAAYGAADIAAQISNLMNAGCEIGLHGIDAWRDSAHGREELQEIQRVTGAKEIGVRMHWLYFDEQSALNVEQAGATYDSTVGYNETVGYRAGTTQAYKPLQTVRLLELPLHIMDTALFYSRRLNLSVREATRQVDEIVRHAGQFGGSVVVNWHDRSIAPERHWGAFYQELVNNLRSRGAWFSTAGQAVSWFLKRRSAVFENIAWQNDTLHVRVTLKENDKVPALQLCIYKPQDPCRVAPPSRTVRKGDITFVLSSAETRISLMALETTHPRREATASDWVTTNVG